jgi:D-beta-D-heptose 7-phosphate kinase/D-beta-D-heptose 1-phosphate adenosyltransferase
MEILENFSNLNVLIVGDIMLDRYWWGSVSRISPEAPVPVVNLIKTTLAAGGAANVAANIAGLGAKPFLVGILGEDNDALLFEDVLSKKNISASYLYKNPIRPTTVKTRIIGHNQQIVRVDQEIKTVLAKEEEDKVSKTITKLLKKVQIIIISDYGKGFLSDNLLERLITTANGKGLSILIDPKGKNFHKYRGASIITPNRYEVAEACKLENTDQISIEIAGKQLVEELKLEALLVTQGEDGMTLFQRNNGSLHLSALAREVYDVTGAGDTVIACLAVAFASGAKIIDAAKLANIAAGLIVEQIGTTAISIDMLKPALKNN